MNAEKTEILKHSICDSTTANFISSVHILFSEAAAKLPMRADTGESAVARSSADSPVIAGKF